MSEAHAAVRDRRASEISPERSLSHTTGEIHARKFCSGRGVEFWIYGYIMKRANIFSSTRKEIRVLSVEAQRRGLQRPPAQP